MCYTQQWFYLQWHRYNFPVGIYSTSAVLSTVGDEVGNRLFQSHMAG